MEKHKLDQLFSQKLSDYQQSPGVNAWEMIDAELNKRKNRTFGIWLSIAASAALAFFSSWYLLSGNVEGTGFDFTYANQTTEATILPDRIVYVPVYIQAPIAEQQVTTTESQKTTNQVKTFIESNRQVPMASNNLTTTNNPASIYRPEITPVDEVPLNTTTTDTPIAFVEPELNNESARDQPPLTIIYKQGEPATESNFTKAINYMEDVRLGEKKLVNFDKLRDNIKSKLKSNKDINSK